MGEEAREDATEAVNSGDGGLVKTVHAAMEMPDDVSQYIIALLSVWDICSLSSCSRHWHTLCSSNFVWYILYTQRWCSQTTPGRIRDCDLSKIKSATLPCGDKASSKAWRTEYIFAHKRMANGASSVIEYVKARACYDSVEVAEYQKAMALLCSMGLEFQDVQMFMLTPKHSVLVNLLGLHYCLTQLKIQGKAAREALNQNKVSGRKVYLRWWSLGGWTSGFRRHDEMHMRVASLNNLTEFQWGYFLDVIDRGILHEVLRVQISADFESSAWVARSMHSQR